MSVGGPVGAHAGRPARTRPLWRLHGLGASTLGTASAVAVSSGHRLTTALVAVGGFAAAGMLLRPVERHARQLPLMRHARAVVGAVIVLALMAAVAVPLAPGAWWVAAAAAIATATAIGAVAIDEPVRRARGARRRIALVGPDAVALALRDELRHSGETSYELAGRVSVGPADPAGHVPTLGALDEMHDIVVREGIDLLVLSPDIPRLPVFERVASSCLELPVSLVDLDSFCERVFGHVPVGAINAAWFQYLMHPRYRRAASPVKRLIDVAVAGVAAVVFAPVIAVVAPLIRRDGGPVLFRQVRIGEGGRPFVIYKLRTMTVSDGPSEWTKGDDPRVTRIGRILRRSHLDEIPQVINVLRGEMSIVGPRPEQPGYVAALEQDIPYYSRRHLIKPGITGWAQVRCGYAGSVEGSAWKMCHDLYYVKHRSTALDLLILAETVRTIFADRQYPEGQAVPSQFARPLRRAEGVAVTS